MSIQEVSLSIHSSQKSKDDADKVEESLRDFISKLISYYDKFKISMSEITKFEEKISRSETLLEVFDVMKEMFEDLMEHLADQR